MPFGIATKALAGLVVMMGFYIGYGEIVRANLRVEIARLEKATDRLERANESYSAMVTSLTRAKSEFEKKADAAEAALATAKARVEVRTETVIRRITENAKPADRDPVSPALRDALGSLGAGR